MDRFERRYHPQDLDNKSATGNEGRWCPCFWLEQQGGCQCLSLAVRTWWRRGFVGEDNCCQMAAGIVSNLLRLPHFFLAHLYDSAEVSKKPFCWVNGKDGKYRNGTSHLFPQLSPSSPGIEGSHHWGFLLNIGKDDGERWLLVKPYLEIIIYSANWNLLPDICMAPHYPLFI